jgi:heptosyltransferase-2
LAKSRIIKRKVGPVVQNKLQKFFFDGTSRLTRLSPRAGSRFLDLTLQAIVGNPLLAALFGYHNRKVMQRLRSFQRFLVIPDTHIGDAVYSQSVLTGLRDFFPDAHVDYLANEAVYSLIEGNPEATRVLSFFSGSSFPSTSDLKTLQDLIQTERYDLCLNFSPFIRNKLVVPDGWGILNFKTHGSVILRDERDTSLVNHFSYQSYRFTRNLLALVATPVREEHFRGVRLTLTDSAVEQARRFASEVSLTRGVPVVLFNPDTASPYTRMPFEKQGELLRRLAEMKVVILLGMGHTDAGIGARLKASLPPFLGDRVEIIPVDMPLDAYSALIDFCDVFVSGDTGPLHLAAARKFSRTGRHTFRNRTAVLSFFGATPARMSGYDSFQPGYLPANQDAPSWSYTAGSPCRNISCLNKMYKTCPTVRCFEEVDMDGLVHRVSTYLEFLAHQVPERKEIASF